MQQQTPGAPGAYAANARQAQSSPVNQLPSAGASAQPQSQAWQPETSRWDSGASRSGSHYGSMPSAGRMPSDPSLGSGTAASMTMSGQPSPGAESLRSPSGSASQSPPANEQRPSNPPLALDGYCSVTLAEKEQWVKGDPRYGVIHRGKTYLFSGADEAKRFFGNPDRFAPVLSGNDVVVAVEENRQVTGKREHGAWYDGKVYLFSSDTSLGKFGLEPARYAAAAAQTVSASARRPSRPSDPPPLNQNSGDSPYGSGARY